MVQTCSDSNDPIATIEARLAQSLDCEAGLLGIAGADSAAPAALGDDEADEEDESPLLRPAAEPLPEHPVKRWWRMADSCHAAWELRFRSPPWQSGYAGKLEATALTIVKANLFGICRDPDPPGQGAVAEGADAEAAAESAAIEEAAVAAATEAGAAAVPLRAAVRSLEDANFVQAQSLCQCSGRRVL